MNRKSLLSIALASAMLLVGSAAIATPAMAADHTWGDHFAISMHGDEVYYAEGGDEADARSQAMFNCQLDHGDSGCTRGTSVPMYENWSIAAIACTQNDGRTRPFSAGSEYNGAYENALKKANNVGIRNSNCWLIDVYY